MFHRHPFIPAIGSFGTLSIIEGVTTSTQYKEESMKKILCTLLAVLMTASLAAGCGSQSTAPATSGDASPATASSAAASGESASPAATPEAKEIKLNIFIAQPRFREQYESYLNQYVEKVKADQNLTLTYEMEMPSADTAAEILKTRLTTGSDLDVFALHAINEIPSFYKAGYLTDLSDQAWTSTLYDSVKTAVTIDGKIVALPLESLTWGYLYNQKLFTELGLKPASTLTEMKANADAIRTAGKTPFLASFNESWIPQLFLPLIVGGKVNTTDKDFITRMNANEGSFSNLSGFFDIIDLVNNNANTDGLEIGGTDGCAAFATGDYGMWLQGPWFSATILESNPDFTFGVAPLPISDDPAQTMINASVSTSLAVSATSKNLDVAKGLVAWFLDKDASSSFFQQVQFNPLSTVHSFDTQSWIKEANTYMEAGKAYVDPSIPQAVKDESGKSLQAYYTKSATQQDVLTALDNAWKTYNSINK